MPLVIPDDVRAKAEIYTGDAAGQEKTRLLLQETELPSGLLPLKDIIECGYVEETGFVWLKQKKKVDHYFAKAGRHVSYAAEVSAIAEKGRLKKITGVKAKEMLIWVTLHEICVDDPPTGKLHCKAMGGITRSFPVEAFEAEDVVVVQPRSKTPAANADAAATTEVAKKGSNGLLKKRTDSTDEQDKKEEEEVPEKKEEAAAAAVDEIDEKMKEMSTDAVQAEAVAAKN